MRMHIELDDDLVARIDAVAGARRRSQFVRDALIGALDRAARAAMVRSARGTIADRGHEWDEDPAAWLRAERGGDPRRRG